MENWRDVVGFEGLYKVNRDGVIWSCYTKRVLKYSISKDGYKQYNLYKDGKPKIMTAHRAVAEAFIQKVEGKNIVNHIDEDKMNCSADNLEWVSAKENNDYMGNRSKQSVIKKCSKKFYVYDKDMNLVGEGFGVNQYAREYGLSKGTLANVLKINGIGKVGKYRTYKGLIYSYNPL